MLASNTRSPERVDRGRSTRRGSSTDSPRPGNSSSTMTPAAAARLRPSTAAAARLTSAMRRRASRMTSASPMISMRASRSVGIGSSTPYRNTATAASTAVHAKRNGVGSTDARHLVARQEQRVADPRQQRRENQNRGTLAVQVGRLHGLRHQDRDAGDQRRICERDVDPEARAAAHQHRRDCPALRAAGRPRTSGASRRSTPAPAGRPPPRPSRRPRAASPARHGRRSRG